MTLDSYSEYANAALENYEKRDAASRFILFDAVKHLNIERVLDVGCGAGQELFPFLEKTNAFCVGIDIADELGKITNEIFNPKAFSDRANFARSKGESLPFANESFDVVLCRVALPYMNNRLTIAEVARILKPNGVFLLKTHAPPFYSAMLKERIKTLNPKQIAYPLICVAGSIFHLVSGKQLEKGFWQGKEIFQTRGFLEKEFEKNGLEIKDELSDSNPLSPSFLIVKNVSQG
ncbi:MAG: class I SAM-dependent methyltransferase [Pyrinomonadaceae bacterium]